MEALLLLIPLSVVTVFCAIAFFFRMSNSGQFDDDQGPAWSVVLDDDSTDQLSTKTTDPEFVKKPMRIDRSQI